ncbi:unnamed protein product, partial [marine sediment metagenome]
KGYRGIGRAPKADGDLRYACLRAGRSTMTPQGILETILYAPDLDAI